MKNPTKPHSYSIAQIISKLIPYFVPEKKRFIITFILVAFKVVSDLYFMLLCRGVLNIVENFLKGGARGPATPLTDIVAFTFFSSDRQLSVRDLPLLLMLMGACLLIFFVGGYFRSLVPAVLISNVAFSMRRALYGHLQCMDLYFFDRTRSGEISSRLTNDIMQGVQVFGMTITVFAFQSVVFVASLYFMWRMDPLLTLITLAIGGLFIINLTLFVPKLRSNSRTVQEKLGIISGEVNEKFGGIKVMQSFTNEVRELEQFTELIDDHRDSTIRMARLSSFTGILGQTIPQLGSAAVLGIGAYTVLKGDLTMADLTFFWMMRGHLFNPLQIFAQLSEQVGMGLGALDRVFEFFDTQSRVVDSKAAQSLTNVKGSVEFRDVSFSYPSERNQRILSHLNFSVEPGSSIALVGASGAGKTTTVDLISRFYDPTEGCVLIDGVDIRNCTLESLRDNVGVVMQEAILFSGSIRENVLYGRPSATTQEMHEALEMANAWEFLRQMKDGIETFIGERGVSISGGQRQRIAIARAFLKNSRILILDEATSALDSVSESLVQEAIERLMAGRTTFVIAHRLSTVAHVDRILVLDSGRLVEQGTHDELLKLNGYFAKFYYQQFKKFANSAT